jgi:hypothetical protein
MMRKSLLTLTVFAGFTFLAQARIGWTLAECEQHYGKAISRVSPLDGQTVYDFTVGNIQITAVLGYNNVVSEMEYNKLDFTNWNIDEITTLMEKNKGECTWDYDNPDNFHDGSTVWDAMHLGEAKLVACWKKDDTKQPAPWVLFILTPSQVYKERDLQQAKQQKNLDNL